MTDWSSAFTVGQEQATLDMTYAGAVIPQVSFADFFVSIQARPTVTTTVKGLEFFVTEALFWNRLVETRLPVNHRIHQSVTADTAVTVTTVGMEDRADVVSVTADITGVLDSAVHIALSWNRVSGTVTLETRPAAQMLWDGWEDFLDIHQQFLDLIKNGRRTL